MSLRKQFWTVRRKEIKEEIYLEEHSKWTARRRGIRYFYNSVKDVNVKDQCSLSPSLSLSLSLTHQLQNAAPQMAQKQNIIVM